ncbi:MAG: acyltransferase family protein [Bacilli bacterium]|nr:acyltransferase family protein [Bacilli bacterium]
MKKREVNYDLLRILAAFMVVFLHVAASKWEFLKPNDNRWIIMNIYDCFVRSAVPLFFMISGAFMLKKETNFKKLYTKILSLTIIYFVWSCLYAIDTIGIYNLKNITIIDFLKTVLLSKYHLWFIPPLIGLYILQPVLYAIVHFEDGKYIKYLLTIFFFSGILIPTVLQFVNNNIISSLLTKIPVELMGYSNYMILGYYLYNKKEFKFKPRLFVVGFVLTVLISIVICQFDALRTGVPSSILYGYFMLPVFIEAILLFIMFKKLIISSKVSKKLGKVTQYLSTLTLGIYLFHPFILEHLDTVLKFNTLSFNPIFSVPIITMIVIVCCLLVSAIMIKIPIIRKLWIL